MDFFISIFENKLLFFGSIAVIVFIIISIILIKRSSKAEEKESIVDIEKIDGQNSVFDEIIEEKEKTQREQLDLDSMIAKMQQDIDAKASEVVEKFEQEQEEKSVISYKELMDSKKENVITDVEAKIALDHLSAIEEESNLNPINPISLDETNILDEALKIDSISNTNVEESLIGDPISNNIEEIENDALEAEKELNIIPIITDEKEELDNISMISEEKEEPISKLNMKDEFVEALKTGNYEEVSAPVKNKFKATEFISPIYGVQNIKMQYPTVQNMKEFKAPAKNYNKFELEQTLNMDKISEEARKDEDFLNALKEFRKNLE